MSALKHLSYMYIEVVQFEVTIEIRPFILDNAAILSGKKIAHFYTISETKAARNLYFQYVNSHRGAS